MKWSQMNSSLSCSLNIFNTILLLLLLLLLLIFDLFCTSGSYYVYIFVYMCNEIIKFSACIGPYNVIKITFEINEYLIIYALELKTLVQRKGRSLQGYRKTLKIRKIIVIRMKSFQFLCFSHSSCNFGVLITFCFRTLLSMPNFCFARMCLPDFISFCIFPQMLKYERLKYI